MRFKKLGRSALMSSVIGQGTLGVGSRENSNPDRIRRRIDALRCGFDSGINLVDTGEDYEAGHSEEVLGKALAGMRDKALIATKFKPANSRYAAVLAALDGSLRRLRTDHVDLYQAQWPNPAVPADETLRALEEAVKLGKARAAGVGNFSLEQLTAAAASPHAACLAALQTEYDLFNRDAEKGIIPFSEKAGLSVLAYSSSAKLALAAEEESLLRAIADKHEATTRQVVLAWRISRPGVVALTTSMDVGHTRENAAAAELRLSDEDVAAIDAGFRREPELIDPRRIRVVPEETLDDAHPVYTTLAQALENRLGIEPSPQALAEEIRAGSFLRPVELTRAADPSGRYGYDLVRGRIRFWAWIIAKGETVPIPARVCAR